MRVLDGAVALLDANAGVEPQTETVWRQADKYNVPRMIFINKMDKIGADFYASVQSVKDRLGGNALEMQLPIGAEDQFKGVVDLVKERRLHWADDAELGAKYDTVDVPAELEDKLLSIAKRLSKLLLRWMTLSWRAISKAKCLMLKLFSVLSVRRRLQ